MTTPDRFDLEQCLMECWHTADDIELIIPQIIEGEIDVDDAANFLIGLRELHNLRMRKAMAVFEELVSAGQFSLTADETEAG